MLINLMLINLMSVSRDVLMDIAEKMTCRGPDVASGPDAVHHWYIC